MTRKNRFALGLPLYGAIDPIWLTEFLRFQSQLGKLQQGDPVYGGLITTKMPYVHQAANTIVDVALGCECDHNYSQHFDLRRPNADAAFGPCLHTDAHLTLDCDCKEFKPVGRWDYLVMIESDNILPDGWLERVLTYDQPIVGLIYFGKVEEDQRPIPGRIHEDGSYERLSYDEVMHMQANPGFHPVDVVGMGATAIRRDVLERWDRDKMPWFQNRHTPGTNGMVGQDVLFCMEAKRQGHQVYVDSALFAEHIGPWRSNIKNYIGSRWWQTEMAKAETGMEGVPA